MRRRDDSFNDHLAILLRLRERAGAEVFARAVEAARVAVARVVLAEAETRAGVGGTPPKGMVVPFPRGGRRSVDDRDGGQDGG